jgi:hypothetical protein
MARWFPTSQLMVELLAWARIAMPAAVSAIDQRPNDDNWRDRCLAAIVRAGAAADAQWLFDAVEGPHWRDIRRLGPLIVRAAGYPVRGTFEQWVDDVRAVAGMGEPPMSDELVLFNLKEVATVAPKDVSPTAEGLFAADNHSPVRPAAQFTEAA